VDARAHRARGDLAVARHGKGILKLTQRDYADHRLSSLVARHGSPGAVNGLVFNALGAKIRGKSKLPTAKRVICFSPHPDDDVISMGGILHKLVENGNDVTVAYMTSGNIAVFDHDVRRHLDFVERLDGARGGAGDEVRALAERVRRALASKRPGDVDIPEVQDIKRVIRESEAVSGIEVMGLTKGNARFLDLPFYQTGKVRKDPIGPEDVAIVAELLERLQPDWCSSRATSPIRTARIACARRRSTSRWTRWYGGSGNGQSGPRCGSIAAPGRSGPSPKPPCWCRSRRRS
jgi:glucosamine-6-phosphate deaminase